VAIDKYRKLSKKEKVEMRDNCIDLNDKWKGRKVAERLFKALIKLVALSPEEQEARKNFPKVRDKIEKYVEGFFSSHYGETVYNYARECKGGVIVEIGSWKGRSTCYMAHGSKQGNEVKVYAVDPFEGSDEHKEFLDGKSTFDEFITNIKKLKVDDIITPMRMSSEEASKQINEPVSMILIDGSHNYEDVKLDFEIWHPKLIKGGIIIFHDASSEGGWEGPKKVVEEIDNNPAFKEIFKKIDNATPTYVRL